MFKCQYPNKDSCKSSLGCNACEVAWCDEQERLEELAEKSKFNNKLFEIT